MIGEKLVVKLRLVKAMEHTSLMYIHSAEII